MKVLMAMAMAASLTLGATTTATAQQMQGEPAAATSDAAARAQLAGEQQANTVGTGGYFGGGYVAGLLLGLIGTGVSYAVAANSTTDVPPQVRVALAAESPTYQQAYQQAYTTRVRSRRKASALGGGLLGTATFLVLYLSANSGN